MYQSLVPLLLVFPRVQSSVLPFSLFTVGLMALSSLLMACHTTVMLMISNSFCPFPLLTHRVFTRISACLRNIQSWMDNYHLKLNPGKTELLTRACRFFWYNIQRIRPFLTFYSTQLLVPC